MEHLKRTFRSRFLRFFASAVRNPVFYRKHPAFLQQDHDLFRFSVLSLGTDYGVADAAFSLIGITNHIGMALFSIVGFFASLFFGILLFYAAISIGSLVSSHKILTAVLSYIGMTTVIQIFGGISIVRVFQDSTPTAVVTTSSVSTLIITVVLCVVLFLICRYILSRRLNLS